MFKYKFLLLLIASINVSSLVAMEKQPLDSKPYTVNPGIQYNAGMRLFEGITFKETDIILVLGCTHGSLAAYIAQQIVPSGKVIVIDSNQSIIEGARKEYFNILNLSFWLPEDAKKISFDGQCDKVISVFFLHWLASLDSVKETMKELAHSLKVGGTFHAMVTIKDTPEYPNHGVRLAKKVIESEKWSPLFKGLMPFGNELELKDYQEAIDNAKLVGKIEVPQLPDRLITKAQCDAFLEGLPILQVIHEELRKDFKNELFEQFETLKNNDGLYVIKSSTALIAATKVA